MSDKELSHEINESDQQQGQTKIKVIGVGGGGCNAIKQMIAAGLQGIKFYAVNTDLQALRQCNGAEQIQLGKRLTNGLGTGGNLSLGQQAAEVDQDQLKEMVLGSDLVFLTAGMGGGTGTTAAPMIARLAKEAGVLTIGVVTKPFEFEGRTRILQAEKGVGELKAASDSVMVIPNQRLVLNLGRQTPIREAFRMADHVLVDGVRGISDLITLSGEINLDFADVRTTMFESGQALMGVGVASGARRAEIAAENAISCPLLDETFIQGATRILVNLTGGQSMSLHEVKQAISLIANTAEPQADIIFGLVYDDNLGEKLKITLIATGFADDVQFIEDEDVLSLNQVLG